MCVVRVSACLSVSECERLRVCEHAWDVCVCLCMCVCVDGYVCEAEGRVSVLRVCVCGYVLMECVREVKSQG